MTLQVRTTQRKKEKFCVFFLFFIVLNSRVIFFPSKTTNTTKRIGIKKIDRERRSERERNENSRTQTLRAYQRKKIDQHWPPTRTYPHMYLQSLYYYPVIMCLVRIPNRNVELLFSRWPSNESYFTGFCSQFSSSAVCVNISARVHSLKFSSTAFRLYLSQFFSM